MKGYRNHLQGYYNSVDESKKGEKDLKTIAEKNLFSNFYRIIEIEAGYYSKDHLTVQFLERANYL